MLRQTRFVIAFAVALASLVGCGGQAPDPKAASPRQAAFYSGAAPWIAGEAEAPSMSPRQAKIAPGLGAEKGTEAAVLPWKVSASPEAQIEAIPPPEAPAAPRCRFTTGGDEPAGVYPSSARRSGEVALTFDDGPHPRATARVLDLLAQHRMPATFFLVGRAIRRDTYALVQRMVAESHSLGSHSYNHDVGMAVRDHGERSIEYIHGNHATTEILIQIALLARAGDDFDALYTRVMGEKPDRYLSTSSLRTDWQARAARLGEALAERGFGAGELPYPIVFSRPPAGTPYVGLSTPAQKHLYTTAMRRLGWLNIMWHGESGDVDAKRKSDFGFLTKNLSRHARHGGVILIHDYIRTDALAAALAAMNADPAIRVVPLEKSVYAAFGCGAADLRNEAARR